MELRRGYSWAVLWDVTWFAITAVWALVALTGWLHTPKTRNFRVLCFTGCLTCLLRISENLVTEASQANIPGAQHDDVGSWVIVWLTPKLASQFEQISLIAILYMWQELLNAAAQGKGSRKILRLFYGLCGLNAVVLLTTTFAAAWTSPIDAYACYAAFDALFFASAFAAIVYYAVLLNRLFLSMSHGIGGCCGRTMRTCGLRCCRSERIDVVGGSVRVLEEPLGQHMRQKSDTQLFRLAALAALLAVSSATRAVRSIIDAYYAVSRSSSGPSNSEPTIAPLLAVYSLVAETGPLLAIFALTLREPFRTYMLCTPLWRRCCCGRSSSFAEEETTFTAALLPPLSPQHFAHSSPRFATPALPIHASSRTSMLNAREASFGGEGSWDTEVRIPPSSMPASWVGASSLLSVDWGNGAHVMLQRPGDED